MKKCLYLRKPLVALTALAALSQAGFSVAQTASAQGLEEIVVVARRTEERLQDVPISVTAISAETIRQASITSSADLIKLVPTLNVQQTSTGGGAGYALRGLRAGVTTYFNEVPVASGAGSGGSLEDQIWDLSSVQALSGPQGTLFGRNSTGGAILFVPQRPTDEFGGLIEGTVGDYNLRQTTAIVNIPVNDMLKVRLGGRLIRRDGYVENIGGSDFQSQDRNSYRASIVFEPNDTISNYTVLDYAERDEEPFIQISSDFTPTVGCLPGPNCSVYPAGLLLAQGAEQDALGIRKVNTSDPAYHRQEAYGISNTFSANLLENMTFKYLASYRYEDSEQLSTYYSGDAPLETAYANPIRRATTHEMQLQGTLFDNKLNWTLGAFMSIDKPRSEGGGFALFQPLGALWSQDRAVGNSSVSRTESQAVFAQGTYSLTEKLNLTAGIRYTEEETDTVTSRRGPQFTFSGPNVCLLGPGQGTDLANCRRDLSGKWDAITYNVSADYRISDELMVYVTTRRGFNAGGFNASAPDTTDPNAPQITYDEEYLTDYEAGLKGDWSIANMPVRTNLSAFYGEYEDIQRNQRGISDQGRLFQGRSNGPEATIQGFQFQGVILPVPSLTLSANYGYIDAKFTKGSNAFSKDNSFAQTPEHTVNLSATYRHDMQSGGQLVGTLVYVYQSEITFDDDQTVSIAPFQKGYDIMDGRLGWDSIGGSNIDLGVWVKNIFDDDYALDKQDTTALFGFVGTVYNEPRTWGLDMRYHFGQRD